MTQRQPRARRIPRTPAEEAPRASGTTAPAPAWAPGPASAAAVSSEPPLAQPSPARPTKLAQLQHRLAAPEGATPASLCAALGWQRHTLRAALTRLRQAGHRLERSRSAEGESVYRLILDPQSQEPAAALPIGAREGDAS